MIYRFAEYRLDADRKALFRGDDPVPVEPQVFDLIRLLADRRGALVSHDEIFAEVWRGRIVSDSALSSRVKAARQALGDTGTAQQMIETRHERGFRLVPDVTVEGAAAPLATPGRPVPTIAVLPFDPFTEGPETALLADGLTEEIITGLARFRLFPVLSRNSTFAYKGQARDIRQIGRELGADYIIEGSVMRAQGRIRVHVQLIEAATGLHLWADRPEAAEGDMFALFDTICTRVAGAIQPELLHAEQHRAARVTPSSQTAWQKWVQAQALMMTPSKQQNARARTLLAEAVALEPDSARLHSALAVTHLWDVLFFWSESPPASMQASLASAARAGEHAQSDAWTLAALGGCRLVLRDHAGALSLLREAVIADPNSSLARGTLALALAFDGQAEAAIDAAVQADRLSPHDRRAALWANARGIAAVRLGDFATVLAEGQRIARLYPDYPSGQRLIAAGAARLGQMDVASRAVAHIKAILPNYRVSAAIASLPFRLPDHAQAYGDALIAAGLPP